MKELVQKVKQWGIDKGLDKVGHLAQARYTLKETAELLDAYADKDINAINDAIGDILVTLIVGASNDNEIYFHFRDSVCNDNECDWVYPQSINDMANSAINLTREMKYSYSSYIGTFITLLDCLRYINKKFDQNLSIKDCLQLAYDEIKDRTGKTNADGHFIKD